MSSQCGKRAAKRKAYATSSPARSCAAATTPKNRSKPMRRRCKALKFAVPAPDAYDAGMQYTLRNIPQKLDKALRQRARLERKSLNQILIDLLRQAVGIGA